eukprot:404627-Amphidinium_carterae.1
MAQGLSCRPRTAKLGTWIEPCTAHATQLISFKFRFPLLSRLLLFHGLVHTCKYQIPDFKLRTVKLQLPLIGSALTDQKLLNPVVDRSSGQLAPRVQRQQSAPNPIQARKGPC